MATTLKDLVTLNRVQRVADPTSRGTVIDRDAEALTVRWDDGPVVVVDLDDAADLAPVVETRDERARGLLRAAIAAEGGSARAYASDRLLRDERTVRRWLSGESPIPSPVLVFLERAVLDAPYPPS